MTNFDIDSYPLLCPNIIALHFSKGNSFMRGSRNFRQGGGGVQVSLTKKTLTFFFSPQLILQKSNGQFKKNLSFFKVPEGV